MFPTNHAPAPARPGGAMFSNQNTPPHEPIAPALLARVERCLSGRARETPFHAAKLRGDETILRCHIWFPNIGPRSKLLWCRVASAPPPPPPRLVRAERCLQIRTQRQSSKTPPPSSSRWSDVLQARARNTFPRRQAARGRADRGATSGSQTSAHGRGSRGAVARHNSC
jgi:hypothetical protein